MPRWPPPTYRFNTEFDVPASFAFRWCTDYRPDDGERSPEHFERRILRRTRREIVFEDLWPEGRGWGWRHTRVTLRPPYRWHADSFGSAREASLDYRVAELEGGRTRFELVVHRRPSPVQPDQPSHAAFEEELRTLWGHYGRAMRRDFRRSKRHG